MNNEQPIKVQEALSYLRVLGFKPKVSTFLDNTRRLYYKIEFSTKSGLHIAIFYNFAKKVFATALDINSQFDDIYLLIERRLAMLI